MEKNDLKRKAKLFSQKYGVQNASYEALCSAAEEQGFTVVEFDPTGDDENVSCLIRSLNLVKTLANSKGLTYADDTYRIIFVHESLSENEKAIVLAHENGHIFLGHLSLQPVIGKDVRDEFEANEFAHYLLNNGNFFKKHKKLLICCGIGLAVIAALLITGFFLNESKYYKKYYVTESGKKYHMADCQYVKNRNDTHRLTKKDHESGRYGPCSVCIDEEETAP